MLLKFIILFLLSAVFSAKIQQQNMIKKEEYAKESSFGKFHLPQEYRKNISPKQFEFV